MGVNRRGGARPTTFDAEICARLRSFLPKSRCVDWFPGRIRDTRSTPCRWSRRPWPGRWPSGSHLRQGRTGCSGSRHRQHDLASRLLCRLLGVLELGSHRKSGGVTQVFQDEIVFRRGRPYREGPRNPARNPRWHRRQPRLPPGRHLPLRQGSPHQRRPRQRQCRLRPRPCSYVG